MCNYKTSIDINDCTSFITFLYTVHYFGANNSVMYCNYSNEIDMLYENNEVTYNVNLLM